MAVFPRARNWDTVAAKIHWDGSKKRTISELKSTVPKQKYARTSKTIYGPEPDLTVNFASSLVTVPATLRTIAAKIAPLSFSVVGGVV
jgi:hypothetical protein